MTTNENILPDAILPQTVDHSHGQPESHWTARNALVDAVRSCKLPQDDRKWVAADQHTAEEQAQWDAYRDALAALEAFDNAHGEAPIL